MKNGRGRPSKADKAEELEQERKRFKISHSFYVCKLCEAKIYRDQAHSSFASLCKHLEDKHKIKVGIRPSAIVTAYFDFSSVN